MPADDYRDGVQGKGNVWKEEVDTDESEQSYESGASSQAAEEYEEDAANASDEYASGLADYFGVDADEVTTGNSYREGVSNAGDSWRQGVSESGDRWRRGVSRASAEEWEQNAADSAEEWFNNTREGITQG